LCYWHCLPWTWVHNQNWNTQSIKQWLRRARKHKKNMLLQPDDARPHTLQTIMEATEKLDLSILPHPPYRPDFASCDFHPFPKVQGDLCGHL
jgi:hypothetical protein